MLTYEILLLFVSPFLNLQSGWGRTFFCSCCIHRSRAPHDRLADFHASAVATFLHHRSRCCCVIISAEKIPEDPDVKCLNKDVVVVTRGARSNCLVQDIPRVRGNSSWTFLFDAGYNLWLFEFIMHLDNLKGILFTCGEAEQVYKSLFSSSSILISDFTNLLLLLSVNEFLAALNLSTNLRMLS